MSVSRPVAGTSRSNGDPDPPDRELAAEVAACLGVGAATLVPALQGGATHAAFTVHTGPDASGAPVAFLRLESEGIDLRPRFGLGREAAMLRAAHGLALPVPRVLGTPGDPPGLLTEMVAGVSRPDPAEVEAVAPEYLARIAEVHACPPSAFPIEQHATVTEAVHDDLAWWSEFGERGEAFTEPLLRAARRILLETAPECDDRPSVVHGDVGAGNFMVDGGRLTAILDWETAHVGDPHEDMAWLWMRGAHTPFGRPAARIAEYEAAAGRPVDRARLRWHLAAVMWKSVVGMRASMSHRPGDDIALVQTIVLLTYEALLGAQLVRVTGGAFGLLGVEPRRRATPQGRLAERVLTAEDLSDESRIVLGYLRDAAGQAQWERDADAADARELLGVSVDAVEAVVDRPDVDLQALATVLARAADRRALALPNAVRRIRRAQGIGLGVTHEDEVGI